MPHALTSMVGRSKELRDLVALAKDNRLTTLQGPGGVGKTRLALEVARALSSSFGFIAHWVELAPVGQPALVEPTIAEALGIYDSDERRELPARCRQLGPEPVLVVLDNCEHVVEAAARACLTMLSACTQVTLVTTSREPLGVQGEAVWTVSPLGAPAPQELSVAELARSEAVQLFVDRARAALPSFALAEGNAVAVARICRQLDGLPLAIELAVPNLRVLSVDQLAENLSNSLAVLAGGPRTSPARHQALGATLDWSYRLLGPAERELLCRLSVFVGPFDLAAAEQVSARGNVGTYELLRQLVDKSWVVARADAGHAHYHLLATVRQYVAHQLAASGEEEEARRAHLEWCRRRVLAAEARLEGATQAEELSRLDREVNDLRAGLEFARSGSAPEMVAEIAAALARFWYLHGNYREGREWLDWGVVNAPGAPLGTRAKALKASGHLAFLQCDYAAAVRRLSTALRLFGSSGDLDGKASTLQVLGGVAREQGRYRQAESHYLESLALYEAGSQAWGVASCNGYLGLSYWLRGNFDDATARCKLALRQFQELGDSEGTAWSLLSLGVISQYQNDLAAAEQLLQDSLATSEEIGFKEGVAWCHNQQGLVLLRRHDQGANAVLLASAREHRELGDHWRLTSVLEALGQGLAERGSSYLAAKLVGAATALRDKIATPIPPCEQPDHEATLGALREALGEPRLSLAFEEGANANLDDLLEAVLAAPEQRLSEHGGRSGSSSKPAAAVPVLTVRVLGASSVLVDGTELAPSDWGYSKPRELFFLLCSCPPRTKEQLGAALWPDMEGGQLRNALHSALRDMRHALGDRDWVVFSKGRYSFNRQRSHSLDLDDFEQALAAAKRAGGPAALPHLQRALTAYGGDFLAGTAAGDWSEQRRRELRATYELALSATGSLLAASGRHREALNVYERAVAHEPLDEVAHRELMKCLARAGQPARALRHYEQLAELLASELGARPAPETVRVYEELRQSRR